MPVMSEYGGGGFAMVLVLYHAPTGVTVTIILGVAGYPTETLAAKAGKLT
jgi:hypothetical protein